MEERKMRGKGTKEKTQDEYKGVRGIRKEGEEGERRIGVRGKRG